MTALILTLISSIYATTVYTTLNQKPFPCFKWQQTLKMPGNRGQPNQPPTDWTNITFEIPPWDLSIQFTHNIDGLNDTFLADIPYYSVDQYKAQIFVSFDSWSIDPWNLWVGTGNEFLC